MRALPAIGSYVETDSGRSGRVVAHDGRHAIVDTGAIHERVHHHVLCHVPHPIAIIRRREVLKASWSRFERKNRLAYRTRPYEVPVCQSPSF